VNSKFKIVSTGLKVRVFADIGPDMEAALTKEETEDIEQWVRSSNVGRRVAWDQWEMKNEKNLSWFLLRWTGE
jgi:hypothetical protein